MLSRRLSLEALEDRALPSASGLPFVCPHPLPPEVQREALSGGLDVLPSSGQTSGWLRALEALPFKGQLTGSITVTPTADPLVVIVDTTATGRATHLGRFTLVAHEVVHLDTLTSSDGHLTLTAANGDRLFADYDGSLTPGSEPGAVSWELHATITGGTGRLAGTAGSFVLLGRATLAPSETGLAGEYAETFRGEITLARRQPDCDSLGSAREQHVSDEDPIELVRSLAAGWNIKENLNR